MQRMQRVDDRVNDAYDRRKFTAWVGIWRDEDGNLYQRVLLWHPLFWWDLFRPNSLYRGVRLQALRSYWRGRTQWLGREEKPEGA